MDEKTIDAIERSRERAIGTLKRAIEVEQNVIDQNVAMAAKASDEAARARDQQRVDDGRVALEGMRRQLRELEEITQEDFSE